MLQCAAVCCSVLQCAAVRCSALQCDTVCAPVSFSVLQCVAVCALRTPEERLPSGAPKEKFGRMIFQKQSSLGDRTKFLPSTSAGARGGAGTCDAPCILGRVLDSAFMQARVRLSCSDGLIYTGRHTFRCHASPTNMRAYFHTWSLLHM